MSSVLVSQNTKLSGVSSYKDTHPIRSGPHPYGLMNLTLIISLVAPSPNTATLGVRVSTYGVGGGRDTLSP